MRWVLLHHGRELARGSRSHVLDVAEERGWLVVETCGRETADPAWLPRWTRRDVHVVPATAGRETMRRAA